jgi:diamine N-acetyltransferase
MWSNERIFLRQVEFDDLAILLRWENNPDNWEVSGTKSPFTEEEMIDFIVEQTDFRSSGQLRLMICLKEDALPVGAIDLFDINPNEQMAGVGILINDLQYRKKGYAMEALHLLKTIAQSELHLSQLYCTIHPGNKNSIRLFSNCGFILQNTEKKVLFFNYQL